MLTYIAKRLLLAVLVLLTVSAITFGLVHLSGDPAVAMAGEGASAEDIAYVREQFGFDRPLPVQYVDWLARVLSGELGRSNYLRQDVGQIILEHAPQTMILGGSALTFALVLSIPLGVYAALHPNTIVDRLALTVAVIGQAMPTFWFALMLVYVFGVQLQWLPTTGYETWQHYVLPSIALGYYATPAIMRLTRAGMLEVLSSDYVRTARAKGLRRFPVLFKHALRNAIIPVVSLSAVQLGFMLGGSVVIETIFSLNGLGHLAWQSIQRSDFEVMQAIVLMLAAIFALLTLIADLLNAFLDPRIRVG